MELHVLEKKANLISSDTWLLKGVKKEVFPTVCTQMMTSLTLTVALFFVYLFQ
jgi:hypothetical protein